MPDPYLSERQRLIEEALETAIPDGQPGALYGPARYVLEGGGKRIRPLFVLLAAEAVGGRAEDAVPAAVAVEVFHNFTLVHDDIMDRSSSRRGRPTVHVRWDEPTAILVGDLLMGIAYDHLARVPVHGLRDVLEVFGQTVARLCEGQILDMGFERRDAVTPAEYIDMIERKTAALLACALELGAIVGGATAEQRLRLRETGYDIGRAFQIQDDLLDLTAQSEEWGKPVGGDILEGKRTYLLLRALDVANSDATGRYVDTEDRGLLDRIVAGTASPQDVQPAQDLMDRLGVIRDTRGAVIFHTDAALGRLAELPESPARDALTDVVRRMQARSR